MSDQQELERPNYYAVIPAEVRYSSISGNAKLLYGEITALTNKNGFCHASNDYFMRLYGAGRRTVVRWLQELEKQGFINVQAKQSKYRKIYCAKNGLVGEHCAKNGSVDDSTAPKMASYYAKNGAHNNKEINKHKTKKKSARELILELPLPENLCQEDWQEWIDYLAQKKKLPVEKTAQAQLKKLAKSPNPRAMIDHCIEKGWQGLFEPDKGDDPSGKPKQSLYDRLADSERQHSERPRPSDESRLEKFF